MNKRWIENNVANIAIFLAILAIIVLVVIIFRKRNNRSNNQPITSLNDKIKVFVGYFFDIFIPSMFVIYTLAGLIAALISAVIEFQVLKGAFSSIFTEETIATWVIPLVVAIAFEGVKGYQSLEKEARSSLEAWLLYRGLILFSYICTIIYCFQTLDNPLQTKKIAEAEKSIREKYVNERARANEENRLQKAKVDSLYSMITKSPNVKKEDSPFYADLISYQRARDNELASFNNGRSQQIRDIKNQLGIPQNINIFSDIYPDSLKANILQARNLVNSFSSQSRTETERIISKYAKQIQELSSQHNDWIAKSSKPTSFEKFRGEEHTRLNRYRDSLLLSMDKNEKTDIEEIKKRIEYSQESHYPFFRSTLRLGYMVVNNTYEYDQRAYIIFILLFSVLAATLLEVIISVSFDYIGKAYPEKRIKVTTQMSTPNADNSHPLKRTWLYKKFFS
jgi:succinate dehydrogenase hydrophobic anchor subunit